MLMPGTKQVAYDPRRYLDIENLDQAAEIILCPTEGLTVKQRWDKETPFIMSLCKKFFKHEYMVLDYGCGVGRLAKPLIGEMNCSVIGVDISPNMRALATSLVESYRFAAVSPEMFDALAPRFDAAVSVWVLQHCLKVQDDIERIYSSLVGGGKFLVVNNVDRCVPVEGGDWADDGLDIRRMILDTGFSLLQKGLLSEEVAPGWMQAGTFWAAYE